MVGAEAGNAPYDLWNRQLEKVISELDILVEEIRGMRPEIGDIWKEMDDHLL